MSHSWWCYVVATEGFVPRHMYTMWMNAIMEVSLLDIEGVGGSQGRVNVSGLSKKRTHDSMRLRLWEVSLQGLRGVSHGILIMTRFKTRNVSMTV